MKFILTLLHSFSFLLSVNAQNYKQVKIYIQSVQDISELQNAGLEFDHPNITKDNAVIAFIDETVPKILYNVIHHARELNLVICC